MSPLSCVCVGGLSSLPSAMPRPLYALPLPTVSYILQLSFHFLSLSLSLHLSLLSLHACLPACLSVRPSVSVSVSMSVRLSVCLFACLPVGFSLLSCIHFHNPCVSRASCLILQSAHAVGQRWNCVTVKTEHGHIQLQLIAKRHRLSFINVSTSWTLSNGALPSLAWD